VAGDEQSISILHLFDILFIEADALALLLELSDKVDVAFFQ
jgi:hypothetical protein